MAHVRPGKPTEKGTPYDVCWEDSDGRKRQKRLYDETKAVKEAGRIEDMLRRGAQTDPRAGRVTFAAVAEEWLATRTRATPDTVEKYQALLETANASLATRRVASITAADIGRFVASLRTTERGTMRRPAGIERIMFPVRAVLRYAVDEGYITRDPARKVETPDAQSLGVDPFEGVALTPSQVTALAAECQARHEHGSLVVWLTVLTGLRAAEVSRVNLGDVNTLHRHLTVRRAKSGKPRRVDFSGALADRLGPYLASHPRAGDPAAPLFYGRDTNGRPDPTRPHDPGTFYKRVFKPAARAVGLPSVRFHDLRHTAGSWWLEAGISLETVSARLGHADINFTRRTYIHALHTRVDEDAARLDAWVAGQLERAGNVVQLRPAG